MTFREWGSDVNPDIRFPLARKWFMQLTVPAALRGESDDPSPSNNVKGVGGCAHGINKELNNEQPLC